MSSEILFPITVNSPNAGTGTPIEEAEKGSIASFFPVEELIKE